MFWSDVLVAVALRSLLQLLEYIVKHVIEAIISFHLLSVNWIPLELNCSRSEDWARCCMVTKWALVGEGFGETRGKSGSDRKLGRPYFPAVVCSPGPLVSSFSLLLRCYSLRFSPPHLLPNLLRSYFLECRATLWGSVAWHPKSGCVRYYLLPRLCCLQAYSEVTEFSTHLLFTWKMFLEPICW